MPSQHERDCESSSWLSAGIALKHVLTPANTATGLHRIIAESTGLESEGRSPPTQWHTGRGGPEAARVQGARQVGSASLGNSQRQDEVQSPNSTKTPGHWLTPHGQRPLAATSCPPAPVPTHHHWPDLHVLMTKELLSLGLTGRASLPCSTSC